MPVSVNDDSEAGISIIALDVASHGFERAAYARLDPQTPGTEMTAVASSAAEMLVVIVQVLDMNVDGRGQS